MYSQCQGKKEILLWFVKIDETVATTSDKPKPPKRPCPDTGKTDKVTQVMSEVDKIVVFDRKAFFKNKKVKNDKRPSQLSPKKRIELHTECMEQLQKWRDLLDKSIISKEQYDELQCTILNDIKQL